VAISIKDPETDQLARALAAATGETLTEAIREALRERLQRQRGDRLRSVVEEIQREIATLPVLDARDADDILGYDAHGLPT
jgi:antitoxin VapB